jgi:hypothetical protein
LPFYILLSSWLCLLKSVSLGLLPIAIAHRESTELGDSDQPRTTEV